MVLVMLIMYAISVPLVVVAFVDSTWIGIVVNFFCVQSYWCLNEVARDLEDPFVYEPNDLPLARYQVRGHCTAFAGMHHLHCFVLMNVSPAVVLNINTGASFNMLQGSDVHLAVK